MIGIRKEIRFKHAMTVDFFKEALISISISLIIILIGQIRIRKSIGVLLLVVYIITIVFEVNKHLYIVKEVHK